MALTAAPDAGAVFKAWTGACAGQGAACNLTIEGATSTNAVFELASAGGGTPGGTAPGGTTGGGTTGGGTSGGGSSGGAGQARSDAAVEVDVIGARGGRSRIGTRIVRLELNPDESVS